jgi:DNA-directed RNA polymerase subunit RPC12/RpoP
MANQGKLLELKRCPHCSVDCPHLRYMDECMTKDHTEIFQRIWVMYACTRCGGVITACSEEGSPYIVEDLFLSIAYQSLDLFL